MAHWPKDFCGRGTGAGGTGTLSRCFVLPDVFFASNDMQVGSAGLRLNACSMNGAVVHLHARLIQHCSRGAPLDVPVALCDLPPFLMICHRFLACDNHLCFIDLLILLLLFLTPLEETRGT